MTFTKEVLTNFQSTDFGHFEDCNLYRLYEYENIVGQFLCSKKVAYILTNTAKLRIDITNHFFKSSKYEIFDTSTEIKIGSYDLPVWRIGWREIGTLTFDSKLYFCKRQKSDIRYNIFKKATWGNYKILLTNRLTEIIYNFEVETNWLSGADSEFRNGKGEIKQNNIDNLLALAGLFFIERMLHNIDSDSS